MTIHTETLKKEHFLIQSFKVHSWHLSLEHRQRSFKVLPAPLKKKMCKQTERSSKSKRKLAEISFRKSVVRVKIFPDLQQIKQIFHCVFFQTALEALLPSWTVLRPNITMYVYKMLKQRKRTKKMKNLQNNPDSRLGWMGQNREPVHFREENAERKNGHTCKITSLDYPALHTPTSTTT